MQNSASYHHKNNNVDKKDTIASCEIDCKLRTSNTLISFPLKIPLFIIIDANNM